MELKTIFWNDRDEAGKRVPVTLSEDEKQLIEMLGPQYNAALKRFKVKNALGYERTITTLTTVMKKITEQKFFEIAPADYVPVRVGEGAWSANLLTYREFSLSDDFSTGIIDTGGNNSRLAQGDAGVDSLSIKVKNWAKTIGWSIFDLELAAKSGNWDIVTAKEKSRKKNWDLGVQKIAFLGLNGTAGGLDTSCLGLLNLEKDPDVGNQVTVDTTTLTQSITSLAATPANLSAFIGAILGKYRNNCRATAWPTHFVVPESDYLGLATPSSATFPIKSILQLMQETFQVMTGNKNFKILPCKYADGAFSGTNQQRYALYNYAEESLRMDIPVDYTNTLANSIDNFSFQNVGYGQVTGVKPYRPAETYYLQFPTT